MLNLDQNSPSQSWLAGALEQFDTDNDPMARRTRSLLNQIVSKPAVHSRFANTLSMLEHMGSYKIMSTQHSAAIDQPTLKHVAEEAQHAYFMKRQAEKIASRPLQYRTDDLLAPASARMFFRRLEVSVMKLLREQGSTDAAYLYLSMIVEFRALWFYRTYQQILKRIAHPMSLKRVIGEEENHLHDMAERLEAAGELSNARSTTFLNHERALFEQLLDALHKAIA